jgi:hypothetical protein
MPSAVFAAISLKNRFANNKSLTSQGVKTQSLGNDNFEIEVWQCEYLLHFNFDWTTRCDHAGVKLELGVFGYELMFHLYDSRHWDYHANTWAVNDQENLLRKTWT